MLANGEVVVDVDVEKSTVAEGGESEGTGAEGGKKTDTIPMTKYLK